MTVPAPVTPTWQNPYVEVIRYGLAHNNVGWQQHGDVEQVRDRHIQKNVFKIRGTIAATNYLRFPRDVSKSNQGLGLTGRYVYIQFRRAKGQQVTLHLDLLTAKKSALRFSFSSMYTSLRSSGTVLRVPLNVCEVWTTLVVDMAEILQLHGFNGYSRECYRYLKAVTCCASMNLRNVVTSSTCFTPQSMPLNLALSSAHERQFGPFVWMTLPAVLDVRKSVHIQATERKSPSAEEARRRHTNLNAHGEDGEREDEAEDEEDCASEAYAAISPMPASPNPREATTPQAGVQSPTAVSGIRSPPLSPDSRAAGLIRDREDILSRADQIMRDAGFAVPSPRRRALPQDQLNSVARPTTRGSPPAVKSVILSPRRFLASEHSDWPDPILSLRRIIGFSTAFPKALRWIPDASVCVYASYSTIVLREFTADGSSPPQHSPPPRLAAISHDQSHPVQSSARSHGSNIADADEDLTEDQEVFLTGHTGEICAMTVSQDGTFLASAQNTPQSVLRLWDLRHGKYDCLLVVKAPSKSIHALTFSKDATAFCCVGSDDHARTQIFVWDSSSLLASPTPIIGAKKLVLRARQTCDFPIRAIAFSPYDSDQLVSCGKENVRFWRIHEARQHLPGSPVILNEYSRGTVFTDIAFDSVYPQFPSNLPRVRPVYVSSSMGSIVVINYDTRDVVCVYKLHDAAINSICVNEGFCVTGSDDKFLRVWPLDFGDFFLEAEHEAPVKSVDVSSDGMRVVVGTSSGAIGVLHLADQRYRTVLRSHTEPAHALAPLSSDSFVSSGPDGTLRVWESASGTQTMEFDVSKDLVTCVTAMPSEVSVSDDFPATIAVGFRSGYTRIFSLGGSTDAADESPVTEPRVLHEFQQHQSSLCDIHYQSDAKTLFTSATGQQLCMYDVVKGYTPIKMLIADMDTDTGKMCLSRDRRFGAVLQHGRRSVLLLDAVSLCVVRVLTPPKLTTTTTASNDSHDSLQELTHVVISWNSQELLALSRADRLYVFSLSESQPGSRSNTQLGSVLHSMPLLGQQGITSFALSPNLKYMATGGRDSSVRIWQCEFGKYKFQRMHQTFRLHAGEDAVRGLIFSNDGRRVIAASDQSSAMFVWRFRGNTSKLPSLELDDAAMSSARGGVHAGHKTGFALPLDEMSNKKEANSATSTTAKEATPKPVETGELKLSTSSSVDISWKHLLPTKTTTSLPCVAWASGIGCLISAVGDGSVVVLENIESGKQHFVDTTKPVEHLALSATHFQLAVLSTNQETAIVCDLRQLQRDENQTEGEDNQDDSDGVTLATTRIKLPRLLAKFFAVEFSVDGSLLCISGQAVAGHAELFVVDIQSGGELVWLVGKPKASPITSILSQSPRDFTCAAQDARSPFQRLRVPPFGLSAASLSLEVVTGTVLPTPPQVVCFRDDGVASTLDTQRKRPPSRCQFSVVVDSDAYCYFMDLERQCKLHTMQLLLPSARSSVTALQWIGSNDWQALIATLSDQSIAVFSLPTHFVFASSKTRVAMIDWPQLKRTGRLTSSTALDFDGQGIAQVLTDPLTAVGMVITQNGAVVVTNFQTGQRRLLRAAPTLQLNMGTDSASPQWALNGALVLTLSGDRSALQCWEPSLGREFARLHVATALCACFTVSPFDAHLAAAGYDDGSLRVFDVNEQRLVTQCVLPAISQRGRFHSSSGKSSASPGETLSILKQKQAAKRSGVKSPSTNRADANGFRALHFIGPRCIVAVTNTYRVVLFDLSDVSFQSASEADETGSGSAKKRHAVPTQKPKDSSIHYRELHLPPPDRISSISKVHPVASSSTSTNAAWAVQIESVDVQLISGHSTSRAQRLGHNTGKELDSVASTSTFAFLIVASVTHRTRKSSVVVAHVFPGNDNPTTHPVHADDDIVQCDSWVVHARGSPLFHPTNASHVVSIVVDNDSQDAPSRWMEIRDCQAHAVVLRLALPGTDVSIPWSPLSLQRWHVHGKSVVVILAASSATSPGKQPVAVVDFAKRTVVRVHQDGNGIVALFTTSSRGDASQVLMAVARPRNIVATHASSDDAVYGLVLAELAYARRNLHSQ